MMGPVRRGFVLAAMAAGLAAPVTAQDTPPTDLKQYFLVLFVNPGEQRIAMPEDIFAAHMRYMSAHHADGSYPLSGPVTDGSRIRGMVIVDAPDLAAATAIVANDPAVKAGILKPEVHSMMAREFAPKRPAN